VKQQSAAEAFEGGIALIVESAAAFLAFGGSRLEFGQVALEADGFGIGQVVGQHVHAVAVGDDAGSGEIEAVDHG
jgi:hypothetical protein